MIEIVLIFPLLTAALCFLLSDRRKIEIMSTLGAVLTFVVSLTVACWVFVNGTMNEGLFYADALSAYMLFIVSLISLLCAIYSVPYISKEYKEDNLTLQKVRSYYIFFNIFVFTMLLVCISNNLGIMWIAIEGTTLASAYLVGLYDRDTSVEAAWKYLIICSVGITLALFGIILFYASSIDVLGESSSALNWSTLMSVAPQLNTSFLKIAFIFILVGFGTKVGLAPMHTWLPDAHSQAPAPVSALLSGVLLNCAMYGILRFNLIISASQIGPGFSSELLIIFGLLSLVIAAAFIIMARDYKRMLAYSSIEHMGIIAIGFGIGGPIGIFAALFQMLSHSLSKTLMFFGAGNIHQKLGTKDIDQVHGLRSMMPYTAVLFFCGALAITGCPPFSIFVGELLIIAAGISTGNYLVVVLFAILLVVIFAAFMYHICRMYFGEPSMSPDLMKKEKNGASIMLMATMVAVILAIGIYTPSILTSALDQVTRIFSGGVA